jgi:hypothetical protein
MAEARITTPDGVSVEVSGTPEEVSAVVKKLRSGSAGSVLEKRERKQHRAQETKTAGKVLISDLIAILKGEEFFESPRGLGDIREKLDDMGHHYPLTTLSGAMQNQARSRQLRRFKQAGKYVYVQ